MTNAQSKPDTTSGTVRQTIVTNLEAPRLQGVATKHFTQFKRKRELYEKQLAEKNREPGSNFPVTSYRASIDDAYLRIFITAHWIKATSLEEITEEELVGCVEARASHDPEGYELGRISHLVRNVRMDTSLAHSEDRVWGLHLRFTTTLAEHGMEDLPTRKPHIAIKMIMKRVEPKALRQRMRDIVEWRRDEGFEKKDFGIFMRELALQAKKFDQEQSRRRFESSDDDSSSSSDDESKALNRRSKFRNRRATGRRGDKRNKGPGRSSKSAGSSSAPEKEQGKQAGDSKRKRTLPKCLNPECSGYHFISDCPNSTEQQKQAFKDDYRARKKQQSEGTNPGGSIKSPKKGIRRLGAAAIDNHTSLFSATFAHGAVESTVMADQGADTNLLPPKVFEALKEADPDLSVTKLETPDCYASITGAALVCHKKVTADVQLRIRHGTRLLLRQVEWNVSDTDTDYVLLGRPTLQAIGCDNRAMLSAACDQHDGVINVPEALNADAKARQATGTPAMIAALMGNHDPRAGIYHSRGGDEQDNLDNSGVYIDLGDDPPEALDAALDKAVERAQENGISDAGAAELRAMLNEYRAVFA